MIKTTLCAVYLVIASALIACKNGEKEECRQVHMLEVISYITDQLPEDYKVVRDTVENGNVIISIKHEPPSETVLEKYVFDVDRKLIEYHFYNDFQERNPLLLSLRLKNGCTDSVSVEGKAMSYRIYKQDTSDVVYVRGAAPVFMKSFLVLNKKGDKNEQVVDSVSLKNNTWAYGVMYADAKEIKYNFLMTYSLNGEEVYRDTLSVNLPTE